jgi:NAD(P)-dependent dehydrogenase (short-subunit alcohol dehydrogenase family)
MKNIVVTGACSGIGLAIVKELIKKQENIIAIGINQEDCDNACSKLGKIENVLYIPIDLSSNKQIDEKSRDILIHFNNRIDVLIHCAATVRPYFMTNSEGYELQFQVNHLAAFHLTKKLLVGIQNAKGMVISTSSRVHRRTKLDFNDLMNRKRYFILTVYRKSKLCNAIFIHQFNRLNMEDGLIGYIVDPGLVNTRIGECNTTGFFNKFWKLRSSFGQEPKTVAANYLKLIYEKRKLEPPYYYKYGKAIEPSKYSKRADIGKLLWEASEIYVG